MYELNFMHFITGVWSPFSFFLFSFSLLLIGSLFLLFSPTCLSNYTTNTYQPAPAESHQQKTSGPTSGSSLLLLLWIWLTNIMYSYYCIYLCWTNHQEKEITIPGRRAETHSLHRCNSRPFPQAPGRHPAARTGHRLYSSLVLNIGESVAADFGEREKIDGKQNRASMFKLEVKRRS